MKYVMIWLIGLYRKYISPLKPPCCRFTPTCSAYAIEAFKKRGFFVGFALSFWRILKSSPAIMVFPEPFGPTKRFIEFQSLFLKTSITHKKGREISTGR